MVNTAFQAMANANQVITTGTQRVTDIVQSLRSFARLNEAEFQVFDVHEGLESTLMLLKPQIGDEITVLKHFGDIPPIYGAPGQLNQVFLSLLKNAAQAIEGKGEIRIKTLQAQDQVEIQISDTGRGIPPEQLQRLFDFGFNAADFRVKMGFGLPTAYKTVQEHNGTIELESKVGKGTEVTISLPRGEAGADELP